MRAFSICLAASLAIGVIPLGAAKSQVKAPADAKFSRIESDANAAFGNGVRIDFDKDPDGAPIPLKTDISTTYAPLGVVFATSFEDSFVAVQSYNVKKIGRRLKFGEAPSHCAANNEPLYQGVMTIRFCQPGDAAAPAGVKAVGFWISHVVPDGTSMEAFDAGGESIGIVKVRKNEVDFLGIESETPIAFIKIIPTTEDLDFAIDDLVFSKPEPIEFRGDLAASGVPLEAPEKVEPIVDPSSLEGRWDVTVHGPGGVFPSWFEFRRSGHESIVGGYVGQFGSVRPIGKVEIVENRFRFVAPPQWEKRKTDVEVEGSIDVDSLQGTLTGDHGGKLRWNADRAPALDRQARPTWGEPIELFNGADLTGWKPRHSEIAHGWKVIDGILTNAEPGNDLLTEQTFEDFKLQAEFRYPKGSNSGIYLRGRYEVQIEDNFGEEADSHKIGGVYGFLTPCVNAAKPAGEWQTIDLELVGRRLTVSLNGERIIDRQIIPGITGGALDSNEGEPGPLMIQGDHGPVEFRKLTLTPAK